jgi:CMP-N-acetylneuraminic acid synthetase
VTEISKKYHPKKIFNLKNNNLNLYLESGKKIFARQYLDQVFIRNGVFYIFKISTFLKNSDIYLKKTYASITNYETVNIDTHKDLKNARTMKKLK